MSEGRAYLTLNLSIRLKHSWMRQKFNVVAEQIQNSKRTASGRSVLCDVDLAQLMVVNTVQIDHL